MAQKPTRRRFIGISAAAAGLALLPFGGHASAQAVRWRGRALGAPAELILHHEDRARAGRLVALAVTEIARLERVFSLYRPDSALVTLNRQGALAAPPPELVDLLEKSRTVWALSGGAFDPTVQPVWMAHARHFAAPGADPSGPRIEKALGLVGFDLVAFGRDRVAFPRPGMALTLNGVAQGYITDRIVELIRDGGATSTLVDAGEIRALGRRGDGTPWRVGIADAAVGLVDGAVATSSPAGFRFGGTGSPGHLLDPRSGRAASRYDSVSVLAPQAATADALSTAFSLMAPESVARIVEADPDLGARLAGADGERRYGTAQELEFSPET